MKNWGHLGLFAGGLLFGTAGISILTSEDAKKVYTHCTAAVLRCRDSVMKTVDCVRENCGDIKTDADAINEVRTERAKAAELARARALVAEAEAAEKA